MEVRTIPFNLDALIATAAALTSVQVYASRRTTLATTTLAASVAIGDATVDLNAHPGVGALLILEPGTSLEETMKVTSVSGSVAPFTATVTPVAWATHSNGQAVNYEPGVNVRMIVDDTPTPSSDKEVMVDVQRGADGQTYRISVIGLCDDGQIVEDEVDLVVLDAAATVTNVKQATETRDLSADFAALLNEAHQISTGLSSAVTFASQVGSLSTTLAAGATAEDSTLSLTAHPGVGSFLTLNPGQANQEKVHVSAVSGGGPYSATIHPTVEFGHSNGETVSYEVGVTTTFLVSANSTIQGYLAVNRARRGAVGKVIRVIWLATTSSVEVLQHSGLVSLQEV